MDRSRALEQLYSATNVFDVVIVGGGATGLGAAVEAAARGHRVVLIEQSDFAKGTSSRSTKLVHGGVRYLRQGNISLVLEALRERGRLARNAPHLVKETAFVIPSYKWWEGPFYGVGMKVYDRLAGKLGLSPSRILSRDETIALIPTVETQNLIGGVSYHDGQFDDARLAVNLAQTADEMGAVVVNYCRCLGLMKLAGKVVGVLARDEETGREFEIRSKAVINATGVFVDEVRRMEDPAARSLIKVSQGIHIVLPKAFLPGEAAIMIPKTSDSRVFFAVPWHDRVVLGTTDVSAPGVSLEPRASDPEREFVMEHAQRYLAKDPTDSDVLSVFAGLRPLVSGSNGASTATLSRDHTILVGAGGLLTITGGKWTTYRKMAEDVVDRAEIVAGLARRTSPTAELPVHGWTQTASPQANLRPYGADAARINKLVLEQPDLGERLHPALPYQQAEVVWHARNEMARTVEDVLARRTRALLLDARASIEAAPIVARVLAGELSREREWVKQQITDYVALARGYVFGDPSSRQSSS